MQDFVEGVFFAPFHLKSELVVPAVGGTAHDYLPAAGGAAYAAGTLLYAKNFVNAVNNGQKVVTSSTGTTIVVSDTGLVDETGASGVVSRVGFKGAAADVTYNTAGPYPALLSTSLDFTTLGLIPGEWIYVGGDTTASSFATAGCNGFKRVLAVLAHKITFDKSVHLGGATDAGTGKSIELYFGRYVRNESDPNNIVRTTYSIERLLGKEATDSTDLQSEVVHGCVFDEMNVTFNTADKITIDLSTPGTRYETRTSAQGKLPGSRPTPVDGGAYNTSNQLVHTGISICGQSTPLYAYLTDVSINIKNNVKPNKALSVLGAFDVSAGDFEVTISATGYFADVTAQQAIADNDSITVELIAARDQQGMVFDMPLGTVGNV